MKIPGNARCCDCGNLEPRWASINLGITLCIACSGVHRSLGVHHSKVRSLTLDAWEPEIIKVMMELGNQVVNKVYEARYTEYDEDETNERVHRATDGCEIGVREAWIKAKYVDRRFVLPIINARNIRREKGDANDTNGGGTSASAKRWSVRRLRRRPTSRNRASALAKNSTGCCGGGGDDDATSSQSEASAASLLIIGKELANEPSEVEEFELSSDQESTGGEDNALGMQ